MRREARTFSDAVCDHQPGLGRVGAGIHQAGAGGGADFHHAQAAVALGLEFRVVAQGRNVDIVFFGRQQECGPRRNLDRFAVNGQTH